MRTSRKALAASFVVTFAAGCEARSSSQQPPTAPTVDVGAAPSSSAATLGASNATPTDSATPAASSAAAPTPPPAPSTGRVERQPDGSCMWYSDVHCPMRNGHIIACNPPPPHKVQCPADGGT